MVDIVKKPGDILTEKIRHTTAHVLALAVKRLYPEVKFGIGPAVENGFYYDFEFPKEIREEDLVAIENEMRKIQNSGLPIVSKKMKREDAIDFFKKFNQRYKLDLISEIPDKELEFYEIGDGEFVDLCRGEHVDNTSKIGAFKLVGVAGAYWKGDSNEQMLQRIYGYSFQTEKELTAYIELQTRIKQLDHRILGKQLGLFSFDEFSAGYLLWYQRGLKLRNKLTEFIRAGYSDSKFIEIQTPEVLTRDYLTSSEYSKSYFNQLYLVKTITDTDYEYYLRPRNNIGAIEYIKSRQYSYKELPTGIVEVGTVHRNETSGELHGLFRTREFTMDDAHTLCDENSVKNEVISIINKIKVVYKQFNLEADIIQIVTVDTESISKDSPIDKKEIDGSEAILRQALKECGISYKESSSEHEIFAPKIEFYVNDISGKPWQCGTIQVDFAQPRILEIKFTNEKGEKQNAVLVYSTIFGSLERFLGLILERYEGKLPLWLAPEQVRIVPISDEFNEYGQNVLLNLTDRGIDASLDDRAETMQNKIREAELLKVPYVAVVGEKEQKFNTVAVRPCGKSDMGMTDLTEFIKLLKEEIKQRKNAEQ